MNEHSGYNMQEPPIWNKLTFTVKRVTIKMYSIVKK